MAKQADHLQELLNTFKVEDSKSLPEPKEKPQIVMENSKNKEKYETIFSDDLQKGRGKKNIEIKSYKAQKPFE